MTLLILGLDGADYRLCQRWGCQNLLLDSTIELKTDAHSIDVPATLEVWPSIATGLKPTEHGVLLDPSERQTRSWYHRVANRAVQQLPNTITQWVVEIKQSAVGTGKPITDSSHIFERGAVTNWPGITPCHDWQEEGDWLTAVHADEMTEAEFVRRHKTHLLRQLGWSVGAVEADYPVAGVHVHFLDHMGHLFAERPDRLREAYELTDRYVGWVREHANEVLIVSDHGMQTTETEDPDPGVHSWHALAAVTGNGEPPESIYDVREWAEQRIGEDMSDEQYGGIDAPMSHLEDLGYI